MNLKYYVSPYDLFEDGTGAPVILHENNGRSPVWGLFFMHVRQYLSFGKMTKPSSS